jgi:hypothetical protein
VVGKVELLCLGLWLVLPLYLLMHAASAAQGGGNGEVDYSAFTVSSPLLCIAHLPTPLVHRLLDGPGRYKLLAIISHMGSSTACGHYVAHIRKVRAQGGGARVGRHTGLGSSHCMQRAHHRRDCMTPC